MIPLMLYRSRRNFGMIIPIRYGDTTYYAKVYRKFVKGVDQYGPLVVGISWETDRGYLVTIERDGYIEFSHKVLRGLDVIYYRLYIACDGTVHVHLIASPPMPKHKALKIARRYSDPKHIRMRRVAPYAGVIRVTPLPCEETLMEYSDGLVERVRRLI